MIVFISCTKSKKTYTCPASELYSASAWFRGGYSYAQSLHPDNIVILSAKYGAIKPDEIISPYEQTLISAKDNEIRQWSLKVAHQLKSMNINFNDEAIFLCGKNYRKYIQKLFKHSSAPLQHMGIGKQLKFFKEVTK